MRIGPAVHGALLVVALLLAYRAWTAEEETEQTAGEYIVWNESPESFESLSFKTENKDVRIERRKDKTGSYLWGKVTRTRKKVTRPDPHGGMHGHGAPGATDKDGDAKKDDAKKDDAKKDGAKPKVDKVKLKPKTDAAKKKAAPKTTKTTKTDAAKASQNDPIPQAKPKAAPAKPKAAPAKPKAAPAPKKDAPKAGEKPKDDHGAAGGPAGEAADATATKAAKPEAKSSTETTVREFPIGEAGEDFVAKFSQLRALRELGVVSDDAKIEYGLDDTTDRLTVTFAGKERTLLVGDRVFGGSDRYVLDETSGKGYVLASDVMRLIDAAETALGLKSYHAFDEVEDLRRLSVEASGTTTELVRLDLEEDEDGKKTKRTTWARADSENIEDVTMANFVDRVSKLRPVEYLPDLDPATLTKLARFSYQDDAKKELGYMELYKGPGDEPARPGAPARDEYYMKTEVTRTLGRVSRLTAERVDQDLSEIISQNDATNEAAPDEATGDEGAQTPDVTDEAPPPAP